MGDAELLQRTATLAATYLDGLADHRVGHRANLEELRAALGGPLQAGGEDPLAVIERLARDVDSGLVATAGPRFFGFVVGGSHPVSIAADWLTTAWDQNAGLYALSPAAALVEEIAGGWLIDLFGLPAGTSVGFVTGTSMANFTGLAAARHAVLSQLGWDVERAGLPGAPTINVVVGDEAHVTVFAALSMLGLGRERLHRVPADGQGRMRVDALAEILARLEGPTIVSAQAGNVNTGAFDPLGEIASAVHAHGGWLHVDGAFGLWATASPTRRALAAGLELADSWSTDTHKWLNVPYDGGLVFVRDTAAHHASMTFGAAYYVETEGGERDNYNWVPESSRRARGFTTYATLRSLGRDGAAALVDRCCDHALRMADRLRRVPGAQVLNDVVLNQVLVRFAPPDDAGSDGDPASVDAFTRDVVARVQTDGTCWLGGTTWHGMAAMRISFSNWSTTDADVDRSAAAIAQCAGEAALAVARADTTSTASAITRV